jgi:CRISPR-associated protein Csx10
MKYYRVTGILESPLVVRRERQSQRSEGVRYISGTLVRGALAQAYLQEYGQPDACFAALFLNEEGCRFGPLDPGEHVFPRTAYSCKREGGFHADGKHGVVDTLATLVSSVFHGKPPTILRCPHSGCAADLKPMEGFWEYCHGQPATAHRRWRRSSATHVGIDRITHTAAEGMLFSLPTMEPDAMEQGPPGLVGWLAATDEAARDLQRLLAVTRGIVRVGHARTRGYGRVRLELASHDTSDPEGGSPAATSDGTQRWMKQSRDLLDRLRLPQLDPDRDFLFTLSLPCGAVLVDQLLRYTLDPAGMAEWLPPLPPPDPAVAVEDHPAVSCAGGKLRCVTAVAQHERLRGWNAAHGLPRRDEWAVMRGAVYAYWYRGGDEGRAELSERLMQLEQAGLGARRNEGFGRVVVGDDFHLRFACELQP